MKRKTTRKDFEEYRAAVEKWLGVFGIKDWCVTFKHEDSNCCAWVEHNSEPHNAGFGLSKEYITDLDFSIDDLALHEVLHLFLSPIMDLIDRREYSDTQNRTAEHRIINVLEKVLGDK